MTYADELRAELERQIEYRRLPPLLMKMIDAYADARVGQTGAELARVKRERLILALRLEGEDPATFAPETFAVMKSMKTEILNSFRTEDDVAVMEAQ